jgi:ATP-dependent Lon protease
LEEIKEKILQIIAIAARKETTMGKIILLVGPPGVGKTSITESIARALGRSYFRISGAMSDPAELKGHRRTFIQAVPGRVIQGYGWMARWYKSLHKLTYVTA